MARGLCWTGLVAILRRFDVVLLGPQRHDALGQWRLPRRPRGHSTRCSAHAQCEGAVGRGAWLAPCLRARRVKRPGSSQAFSGVESRDTVAGYYEPRFKGTRSALAARF